MTQTTYFLAEAALRRNFQDLSFCPQDKEEDLARSKRRSLARLSLKRPEFTVYTGESEQAIVLPYIENALLPPAFHQLTEAAWGVNDGQALYAAVNVEEHLLLKARGEAEDLGELIQRLRALEQDMEDPDHPYARNKRFEYLSYRPVLAGSGLHAAFVMHLPMLVFLKQIRQLTTVVREEQGCLLKPFGHPDRQGVANLFLLTNASSQGLGDAQILDKVLDCAEPLSEKGSAPAANDVPAERAFRHAGPDLEVVRYPALRQAPDDKRLSIALEFFAHRRGCGRFSLSLKEADAMYSFARDSAFAYEGEEPRNYPLRRADAVRRVLSGG